MKFDHRVKINGHWYDAGVEISTPVSIDNSKAETKKKESKLKRSDIQKMDIEALKEVAKSANIEFTDDVTVNELKKSILVGLGI